MQLLRQCRQWQMQCRYHFNKWKYDSAKWMERVWFGEGKSHNVARVPFMITLSMRKQLEDAGFPLDVISNMQPATAYEILQKRVSYEKFLKERDIASIDK